MKATLTNVLHGLCFGLLVATAFTGWIKLIRMGSGDAPFERTGTPFLTTVLFYYSGFSVGGLLAGGLWSLLRRRAIGWAIMGAMFVAPVYAMFLTFKRSSGEEWSAWRVVVNILAIACVGGLAGLRVWSLDRYDEREPRTNWRFVTTVLLVGGALSLVLYVVLW